MNAKRMWAILAMILLLVVQPPKGFAFIGALAFPSAIRNGWLDDINAAMNAGAGACLIRGYDGSRPATGGAATTLLFELTASDPAAGAAAAGVLTFSAITQDASANATGTVTWFRIVDSSGAFVMDGNVGTAGSDMNLTTTSIVTGQPVSLAGPNTITAPNA